MCERTIQEEDEKSFFIIIEKRESQTVLDAVLCEINSAYHNLLLDTSVVELSANDCSPKDALGST
jgi:uncharacterized protein YpbB